jgi:hypothetical protein
MEPLPWWTQGPTRDASMDAGFGSWVLGMLHSASPLGGIGRNRLWHRGKGVRSDPVPQVRGAGADVAG